MTARALWARAPPPPPPSPTTSSRVTSRRRPPSWRCVASHAALTNTAPAPPAPAARGLQTIYAAAGSADGHLNCFNPFAQMVGLTARRACRPVPLRLLRVALHSLRSLLLLLPHALNRAWPSPPPTHPSPSAPNPPLPPCRRRGRQAGKRAACSGGADSRGAAWAHRSLGGRGEKPSGQLRCVRGWLTVCSGPRCARCGEVRGGSCTPLPEQGWSDLPHCRASTPRTACHCCPRYHPTAGSRIRPQAEGVEFVVDDCVPPPPPAAPLSAATHSAGADSSPSTPTYTPAACC